MPWTEITRPHYDRRALRYASDCTDDGGFLGRAVFELRHGEVGDRARPTCARFGMRSVYRFVRLP